MKKEKLDTTDYVCKGLEAIVVIIFSPLLIAFFAVTGIFWCIGKLVSKIVPE